MVLISGVDKNSLAQEKGIEKGDKLLEIDGKKPRDYIDYMLGISSPYFELLIEKQAGGQKHRLNFNRSYGDQVGLEFEELIFDELKTCQNDCFFCFVDQQPPDVRDTLSCKDDDYRFSFLKGSFITLTNLSDIDYQRIVDNSLSPLYISVHTTNPDLRERMMSNKKAGRIKSQLEYLEDKGIKFHVQLVICPGWNDGEELDRTLDDLLNYSNSLLSAGIVPVGLTAWREKDDIKGFNAERARKTTARVKKWQKKCRELYGENIIFLADEFYLLADESIPEDDHYRNYPQLSNGIGLTRLSRIKFREKQKKLSLSNVENSEVNIITGELGRQALEPVFAELDSFEGLNLKVIEIENCYLGGEVTVTGLLSGKDIIDEIESRDLKGYTFIPEVIFNDSGLTLDDLTLSDISEHCGDSEVFSCSGIEEVLEVLYDGEPDGSYCRKA